LDIFNHTSSLQSVLTLGGLLEDEMSQSEGVSRELGDVRGLESNVVLVHRKELVGSMNLVELSILELLDERSGRPCEQR